MLIILFKTIGTKVWIFQYKDFGTNLCMSKYREVILSILSKTEIKSTNEILSEVQDKTKKVINWHALYRVLMELNSEGKIERLQSKAGFFWKKK